MESKVWLQVVFFIALSGVLTAFAEILYNLPIHDDFDDHDDPPEEDEW